MALSETQLAERVNYLGGSDCSAILGLSRFSTPLQVFMSKLYPNNNDNENRIGGKREYIYWGNKLENKVAEAFTEVTGKKVYKVNETLVHPQYPFIRANIDRRVVGEDAILEVKTATVFKAKEWEGEEIPIEYIFQVQHYLAVTGKDKGYFACLIGGQKFIWKEIRRDEELIKEIINAEVDFWNKFILTKEPPMVTGSERDSVLLERLYPEAKPDLATILPMKFEDLISQREELQVKIAELEESVNKVDNEIKSELKDCESGTAGKYLITWKNQTRASVDTKKLKDEYPDVFSLVQRQNSFRALRFKETNREDK